MSQEAKRSLICWVYFDLIRFKKIWLEDKFFSLYLPKVMTAETHPLVTELNEKVEMKRPQWQ